MKRILPVFAVVTPLLMAAEPKHVKYPPTRTDSTVEKIHGVEVADPYRWLENADSPEVREWVEGQNAFAARVLEQLPGQKAIHDRLDTLLDIGLVTAPAVRKGHYFHLRREGKQNQAILYVRDGVDGADRALVDPNALATDGTIALDWWYPSRDGKLLAHGLSASGSEQSVLHVRDVATGKDLPDKIERTRACSLAWTPDGKGFYYTRYPAPETVAKGDENYNRHVFFHSLGDDPAKDAEVFGEGRANTDWPNVELSPDGRWLVVTVEQGWTKTEVYFKDSTANEKFRPLVEGVEALFTVTVRNDRFFVHTNEKAPRYKLMAVDPADATRAHWKELIAEGSDVLDGVSVIGTTIVAQYMHDAHSLLKLHDGQGKLLRELPLPTLGSIDAIGGEWDGDELFYGFQSFTVAPSVYRLPQIRSTDQSPTVWVSVKSDIDFSAYQVEQVKYPSKDGTMISMFLASKKNIKRNGDTPTLLYGYGGFNQNMTPTFGASRLVFLERGGLLAIANLRGGGEYGEAWHQAGMLGKKQNVFDDFIAAAEWLIHEKYTSPDKLAIQGGSNGGLLMGAALTQRPDLFRCVVCQVPLLDMLRYQKFLIAKLWVPEYGSADDPEQFKWLYAYSPYHHVKKETAYPAVMLRAAESDTRVDALHARKMTAALQAATSSSESDRPIILILESKAGHGAGKPRAKVLSELTDTWSFIFWQLKM